MGDRPEEIGAAETYRRMRTTMAPEPPRKPVMNDTWLVATARALGFTVGWGCILAGGPYVIGVVVWYYKWAASVVLSFWR